MPISFVIPMYNSEMTITKCLDSILKNSGEYEIIIVNDGSTDNSENIVKMYIKQNGNCNIKLYNKKNAGVSSARNYGLSKANGRYVWFVDSDDIIMDNSLNTLHKYIVENYDIIKFNYIVEKIPNKLFLKAKKPKNKIAENFLYNYTLNSPCTQIYRIDFLRKNDILFEKYVSYGEDYLFNLNAYSKTTKVRITNYYLYIYKKSQNSITRNYDLGIIGKKICDIFKTYGKLYDYKDIFKFKKNDIINRIYNELIQVLVCIEDKNQVISLLNSYKSIFSEKCLNTDYIYKMYERKRLISIIKRKIKELLK